MLELINFASVFSATFLSMAVGIVWYSPTLFGRIWQKEHQTNEIEKRGLNQIKIYIGCFSALFVTQLTLACFVSLTLLFDISVSTLSLVLTVFAIAVLGSSMVWERRSFSYFLVAAGFLTTSIIGGVHILAFWPW